MVDLEHLRCIVLHVSIAGCMPSASERTAQEASPVPEESDVGAQDAHPIAVSEFGDRGFVPPIDTPITPPFPPLLRVTDGPHTRIWWIEDMGALYGMALLWRDAGGIARGKYYAWRFSENPDGRAADSVIPPASCIRHLRTEYLVACELDVGLAAIAEPLLHAGSSARLATSAGDPLNATLHPNQLYVELLDTGKATLVHYCDWTRADQEHQAARAIREHMIRLQEAAKGLLLKTPT